MRTCFSVYLLVSLRRAVFSLLIIINWHQKVDAAEGCWGEKLGRWIWFPKKKNSEEKNIRTINSGKNSPKKLGKPGSRCCRRLLGEKLGRWIWFPGKNKFRGQKIWTKTWGKNPPKKLGKPGSRCFEKVNFYIIIFIIWDTRHSEKKDQFKCQVHWTHEELILG